MSATFSKKIWVQLVTNQEVERCRARYKGSWLESSGVREHWWREVRLTATPNGVTVHLGSVDEEAACGGYCSGWHNVAKHVFAWDDLFDVENIPRVFERESHKVVKAVEELFAVLRPQVKVVRELLAETHCLR